MLKYVSDNAFPPVWCLTYVGLSVELIIFDTDIPSSTHVLWVSIMIFYKASWPLHSTYESWHRSIILFSKCTYTFSLQIICATSMFILPFVCPNPTRLINGVTSYTDEELWSALAPTEIAENQIEFIHKSFLLDYVLIKTEGSTWYVTYTRTSNSLKVHIGSIWWYMKSHSKLTYQLSF